MSSSVIKFIHFYKVADFDVSLIFPERRVLPFAPVSFSAALSPLGTLSIIGLYNGLNIILAYFNYVYDSSTSFCIVIFSLLMG